MHLLVAFAADTSEACRHVLRDLALPNLERLLALLAPAGRDDGDVDSLSPPHERALASAWRWHGGDGRWPFAARRAALDGIDVGDRAWAMLTPSHWQLGGVDVTLLDPALLALDDTESRALFDTAAELFASEGFAVAWGGVDRWYASRDDLDGVATASLDRAVGGDVDRWLRASAERNDAARAATMSLLRRLQSEVQLAFHVHDVNDRREERGDLVVNSLWLSGCGRSQDVADPASPTVVAALRAPLVVGDWAAWGDAWRTLDGDAIVRLLHEARDGLPTTLTLCGERSAARFELQPRSLWQRLRGSRGATAHDVLASL